MVVTRLTRPADDVFLGLCCSCIFRVLKFSSSLFEKTSEFFAIIETRNGDVAALSSFWIIAIVIDDPSCLGVIVCIYGRHK
jgi:hypothetical protein